MSLVLVWKPAIFIRFGVLLLAGSEKYNSLPLSVSRSLSHSIAAPLLLAYRNVSLYVC